MKTSQSLKFILLAFILLLSIPRIHSQCPENEDDLIINTQEKHDYFFANYPDCKEYHIIMMDGKYIGDPRPLPYLVTLFMILGGILFLLKYLLDKSALS